MHRDDLIVVTGAGGFIGGHLVADLWRSGHRRIRAVDIKPIDDWFQTVPEADNRQLDLRRREACIEAADGARHVYNLACDMGGMGFIGGHVVAQLLKQGVRQVRAVDVKPLSEWYQAHPKVENLKRDLRLKDACYEVTKGVDHVINLAADMGGMGFIEHNKALCMLSSLVTTHMLLAARDNDVQRLFYSSSACVYAAEKQTNADVTALKEDDAYPAMPEDGYGWEKLFGERMCRHFREDYGLETRVARYHNVYGPHGSYDGGREKAPAAICRKVIAAMLAGCDTIEIWGDGEQTRSFMYIDDCLFGTRTLMASDVREPLNIGSNELVTINQLVDMVEAIAGCRLTRRYNLDAPKGVRGRSSDNTLIQQKLGWAPPTRLQDGLAITYRWIYDQMTPRVEQRRAYS